MAPWRAALTGLAPAGGPRFSYSGKGDPSLLWLICTGPERAGLEDNAVHVRILTYCHQLWEVMEGIRLRMPSFFWWFSGHNQLEVDPGHTLNSLEG